MRAGRDAGEGRKNGCGQEKMRGKGKMDAGAKKMRE